MLSAKQQTKCEDKIREFLQSIAVLAVQAQDYIGQHDRLCDTLQDISSDIERMNKWVFALADDDERKLG